MGHGLTLTQYDLTEDVTTLYCLYCMYTASDKVKGKRQGSNGGRGAILGSCTLDCHIATSPISPQIDVTRMD